VSDTPVPMSRPSASLMAPMLSDTNRLVPSLRILTVSQPRVGCPSRTFLVISRDSSQRSGGIIRSMGAPHLRAEYPNSRSQQDSRSRWRVQVYGDDGILRVLNDSGQD